MISLSEWRPRFYTEAMGDVTESVQLIKELCDEIDRLQQELEKERDFKNYYQGAYMALSQIAGDE